MRLSTLCCGNPNYSQPFVSSEDCVTLSFLVVLSQPQIFSLHAQISTAEHLRGTLPKSPKLSFRATLFAAPFSSRGSFLSIQQSPLCTVFHKCWPTCPSKFSIVSPQLRESAGFSLGSALLCCGLKTVFRQNGEAINA